MIRELYIYCFNTEGSKMLDADKRDGQRVGAYLASKHIAVSRIFCQPTELYEEVVKKMIKAMGNTHIPIQTFMPDDKCFNEMDRGRDVPLFVCSSSHLPIFLPQQNEYKDNKAALLDALSCLQNEKKDNGEVRWTLQSRIARSALPAAFPYPAPDGIERRPRPAYYYSQSAVIPFRSLKNGEIEVLVIGSSKRKHQVVPKGIVEPGLSPQDSAAKESLEEAGVIGDVLEEPVGCYHYAKWGAECRVSVYAQKVKELLTEEQWEECHRGRQWMSLEDAALHVKNRDLGQIISTLGVFLHKEFA